MIWDWPPVLAQVSTWEDGLAAALKELINRGHEVNVYMPGDAVQIIEHPYFTITVIPDIPSQIEVDKPDVVLIWGDMTRPNARKIIELNIPMALCFAGGDVLGENLTLFDHVFIESQVYAEALDEAGYTNFSIAFGANTELFTPIQQNKQFDTIFPATFAAWKRHNLYASATKGLRALACGYIYHDHEQECWQDCLKSGVTILPHTSARVLKYLYAASRVCVIPSRSDGGSQRTVLEAMAMNLPIVTCDSNKYDWAGDLIYRAEPNPESIRGYIDALLDGEQSINTRDWVLNNMSHIQYADALEKGLRQIVS
jgi:glycosyltransferase involved in cell wall biosynthesis